MDLEFGIQRGDPRMKHREEETSMNEVKKTREKIDSLDEISVSNSCQSTIVGEGGEEEEQKADKHKKKLPLTFGWETGIRINAERLRPE